jgi:hypothetical protein
MEGPAAAAHAVVEAVTRMLRFAIARLLLCAALVAVPRLAGAEPVPFESARLVLRFGPMYEVQIPPESEAGAGGVADVSRSGGVITRIEFPGDVFAATDVSIPFETTMELAFMPPIGGVQLTVGQQAGTFAVATPSGPLQGTLPLSGVHKFCTFFAACGASPTQNVTVPLTVIGKGGTAGGPGLPSVFLVGGTWTTGSVTVDGPDEQTFMLAGALEPGTSATLVRLVTPVFLSTNTTGTYPTVRGFGLLTFGIATPEPGAAIAIASAIAALVALGWRRR